jgi:hypothetical protein
VYREQCRTFMDSLNFDHYRVLPTINALVTTLQNANQSEMAERLYKTFNPGKNCKLTHTNVLTYVFIFVYILYILYIFVLCHTYIFILKVMKITIQ